METSFLSDLAYSKRSAIAYWDALKRSALGKFSQKLSPDMSSNFPSKSLVWPLVVYGEPYVGMSISEFLDWEKNLVSEKLLFDATPLQLMLGTKAPDQCTYLSAERTKGIGLKLVDALQLIDSVWPEAYLESDELIRAIVFVRSNKRFSSTSDPKLFGLLHLDEEYYESRSIAEMATAILHESGHHALFVASARAKIIMDPGRILFSPLRREDRPAIGVVHAAAALYRMISWGKRLEEADIVESSRIRNTLVPKFTATMKELDAVEFSLAGESMKLDLARLIP